MTPAEAIDVLTDRRYSLLSSIHDGDWNSVYAADGDVESVIKQYRKEIEALDIAIKLIEKENESKNQMPQV